MFKLFTKKFDVKDRKIANQKVMIENRDKLIKNQEQYIETLRLVINSLEEDLQCAKEQAYKTAKKPATRKKTK